MINLFQPAVGKEELDEVAKVFQSNWLGKGNYVKDFEKGFANNLNVSSEHFLSTTSCTEAIFLSADLFEFSSNDEIIIPSISFPSIGSAVLSSGAKIVFCDVDKRSLNVRADDIKSKITNNTKAVYVTHYGGVPCDMDPIIELCNIHNIKIIEDSACSIKSFYKGKACGTLGDMGMWSFDAMKTLSTADGGMMYIKDLDKRKVAEEKLYLGLPLKQKSGIDSSTQGNSNWWEFEMNRPGRRAIMNNVTGAIGCVQLNKLNKFLQRREYIYNKYYNELKKLDWLEVPPMSNFEYTSSFYFFWIQTKYRDKLARYLLDNGVYTTFRYWPLHKVNLFKEFCVDGDYPNADFAAKYTLNIPLHQELAEDDIQKIITLIKEFNAF
ncbi:DegT/DnrJ/EryC1/StrS aminotransferase family protein [Sulfurospirillum sp. UCH001]|uniref:DegT/DnrJ/EryC1/StrS family aminotransferase n=1 Tax=Sulfurospirillum sp. UCH001 TaxID=1581011 RepID=UPI0008370038|nr:DegT/DnrJ/EryC1/StrS family aminotransferase [Sulfurospirillum sp. UCH001]